MSVPAHQGKRKRRRPLTLGQSCEGKVDAARKRKEDVSGTVRSHRVSRSPAHLDHHVDL